MTLFKSTKGSSTILTILLTALIVGFGVYFWQQQKMAELPITDESEKMTEETKTPLTFKDKIEDFDSYQPSDYENFASASCNDYADFHQKLMAGEVKEKMLYDVSPNRFVVYLTPNYENWTTDEFKNVDQCMEGVGQAGALKAFKNYLLWGHTNCGGAAPSPTDMPELYAKFMGCEYTAAELRAYLEQ